MTQPSEYRFTRYLAAKKSVDDRALNRHVWSSLRDSIAFLKLNQQPLRVLEIGAGIGTMVERVLEWQLWGGDVVYTAIDADPDNIATAYRRLHDWGDMHGYEIDRTERKIALVEPNRAISLALETIDVFDFIQREAGRQTWDLLIAHAFLDLIDIPSILPSLFSLIQESGLFYFTINFDGLTILEPAIDVAYDARVMDLYHRSMDERRVGGKPSGDSRTGRHLFDHLREVGASVIDAGSSDWVVFPGPWGYPEDEAYFLHFMIHTIDLALRKHPELDAGRFADWVAERHAQIEKGILIYIAHQLDLVGQAHSQG